MSFDHLKSWRFSLRELFALATLACVLLAIAQIANGISAWCGIALLSIGFGITSLITREPKWAWLAFGSFVGLFLVAIAVDVVYLFIFLLGVGDVAVSHLVALASISGMVISYAYHRRKHTASQGNP